MENTSRRELETIYRVLGPVVAGNLRSRDGSGSQGVCSRVGWSCVGSPTRCVGACHEGNFIFCATRGESEGVWPPNWGRGVVSQYATVHSSSPCVEQWLHHPDEPSIHGLPVKLEGGKRCFPSAVRTRNSR